MKPNLLALALAASFAAPLSAAERAIDKQVRVAAGVDAVWTAWTTREGVVGFFAPDAVVEPRVGGLFEVRFDPYAPPGERGADDMRFLALQPKRMLSFTWNAPPSLPQARAQRTVVVVRLVPEADGATLVTLHHTGWGDGGEWDQAFTYFDRAWGRVLGNLQARFERGPVDWTAWLAQLRQAQAASAASGAGR